MKKTKTKLTIRRQTLHRLTAGALATIAGGYEVVFGLTATSCDTITSGRITFGRDCMTAQCPADV